MVSMPALYLGLGGAHTQYSREGEASEKRQKRKKVFMIILRGQELLFRLLGVHSPYSENGAPFPTGNVSPGSGQGEHSILPATVFGSEVGM